MSPLESPESSTPLNALETLDPRTRRVVELSMKLCKIPSVTVPGSQENLKGIKAAHRIAKKFALKNGLTVNGGENRNAHYPYLVISFTETKKDPNNDENEEMDEEVDEKLKKCVALVGHLDVVAPQQENQFTPRIENGMLIARGAADMKTVVATQLVWMAEQQAKPGPKLPVILMLSSCEENGSLGNGNTRDMIPRIEKNFLDDELKDPEIVLAVVGERTGEIDSKDPRMIELMGKSDVGPICDRNRGWRWFQGKGIKHSPHGFLALKGMAEIIKDGRELAKKLNGEITSKQMVDQPSWRTGFVNSFATITADSSLLSSRNPPPERTWVLIEKGGTAAHSATITPNQPATLEEFYEIASGAMGELEGNRVHIASVRIGEEGNFNVIAGGGSMILVIDQGAEEIQNWLPNQLPPGITYFVMPQQPTLKDHIVREDPPTFGIDLREIPEHTSTMNKWLGTLKNTLRARLKMWLKIINDRSECICAPDNPDFLKLHNAYEGSGWICPPDNPAFQKLRAAYEKITGIPSTPLGKLHGNDGRFFNGKAVVWGQKGIAPHGAKEAHDIGSILPYLKILDEFGESLLLSS